MARAETEAAIARVLVAWRENVASGDDVVFHDRYLELAVRNDSYGVAKLVAMIYDRIEADITASDPLHNPPTNTHYSETKP